MTTMEREKFVRLANKRVNAVLKAMQVVGRLSNTSNYEYSAEDVERMFDSMQRELDDCRKRFELAMNVNSWVRFSLE